MKKFITLFIILSVVSIVNTSTHNSIWPSSNLISNEGKTHCVQFQFLRGSNRTAEFKKVYEIVFGKKWTNNNTEISTENYTLIETKKMFGKPDVAMSENTFRFILNPDVKDCFAEFSYSNENHTISCRTSNCN